MAARETPAHPPLDALQRELAALVDTPPHGGDVPHEHDHILALDIQYDGDLAHVAGALSRGTDNHVATYACVTPVSFPYMPGYFCFREGPPLLALIEHLRRVERVPIDLLIVDGHGLAHPRRLAVACWLGVATALPTLRRATRTLVHYALPPGQRPAHCAPASGAADHAGGVGSSAHRLSPLELSSGLAR